MGGMDKFFSNYARSCFAESAAKNGSQSPESSTTIDEDREKVSSLEILNSYRSSDNSFNVEWLNKLINKERTPNEEARELSTEEIMRVAAAYFIRASDGDPSKLMDPHALSFSGLNDEEIKNVELASRLLAAAQMVSKQQHDWARELLKQCCKSSSGTGNPVQRVVYYFSDALLERIDRETGSSTKRPSGDGLSAEDVIRAMRTDHPVQLVTQQKLPFSQLVQFVSIQTILDNLGSAKRIHMIDISVKHGLQWVVLIQALATRSTSPIEYLKISAVGTSESSITTTGKRLVSFAETLSISFDFKAVIVIDIKNLKEDMFEVKKGETVGVYSSMDMNSMIVGPESLENLIRVLKRLKPCIMTVADVEAKHNSPSFINRFTEALFYYSAIFDYLHGYMDKSDLGRMFIEWSFLSPGIKSIITTEGSERVVRHVGINVWRSFFARFGLVETELCDWSQYQANVLVKQFAHGNSCTLDVNGKSLMAGWKGTPLLFISAWKFL